MIESAKRHGHQPYTYLKDLLERLPSTTTTGLDALLPAN
ncbi:MAG: transposase domain-containing protein [Luteolibacter sp.]